MQVEVGQIVNTHGIKGEIEVKSNFDFTDTRFQPGEALIVSHHHNEIEMTITSYRIYKGFHMLKSKSINNINDIEQYKGGCLFQERDHEDTELNENEFYYSDITGCTVSNNDTPIGRVTNIFETGASDVRVVRGDKEYLILYIADVVKEVDVEHKTICITPTEGLLE